MNLPLIVSEFFKEVKNNNVIAIAPFSKDLEFISLLVDLSKKENINLYYIAVNAKQAKHYTSLFQKMVSLNDKEIDVALELADQVDYFNNFIKIKTNSFIRDKMISQSALKLVVLTNTKKYVPEITSDVCVEISTFAWQRTVIHLQSFGLAQVLYDENSDFIKTEIGHFLVKIKLDKNITLDDFEYSVRNIPGVLESGVFLGLLDTIIIYDHEKESVSVRRRE